MKFHFSIKILRSYRVVEESQRAFRIPKILRRNLIRLLIERKGERERIDIRKREREKIDEIEKERKKTRVNSWNIIMLKHKDDELYLEVKEME